MRFDSDNILVYGLGALIASLFILLGFAVYYEFKHPCIKYSEEKACNTHFIMTGKIMVPTTTCSNKCLQREGEGE